MQLEIEELANVKIKKCQTARTLNRLRDDCSKT